MLPGWAFELFINVLAGGLTVVVFGGLPGIGVDVLVDVNVNADVFAGVKFLMPAPLKVFCR